MIDFVCIIIIVCDFIMFVVENHENKMHSNVNVYHSNSVIRFLSRILFLTQT